MALVGGPLLSFNNRAGEAGVGEAGEEAMGRERGRERKEGGENERAQTKTKKNKQTLEQAVKAQKRSFVVMFTEIPTYLDIDTQRCRLTQTTKKGKQARDDEIKLKKQTLLAHLFVVALTSTTHKQTTQTNHRQPDNPFPKVRSHGKRSKQACGGRARLKRRRTAAAAAAAAAGIASKAASCNKQATSHCSQACRRCP